MVSLILNLLAAFGVVYTLTHTSSLVFNKVTRAVLSTSAALSVLSSVEILSPTYPLLLLSGAIVLQDAKIQKFLSIK